MPIDRDSVANFRRAGVGDGLLGVYDSQSRTIYLALAQARPGATFGILDARHSSFRGVTIDPLPGAGGHARLAQTVGIEARQLAPAVAIGHVFGFSIVKTDRNSFELGTLRSGFNMFYRGDRPAGGQRRTLPRGAAFSRYGDDYMLTPDPGTMSQQIVRQANFRLVEMEIRPLLSELTALTSQDGRSRSR